MQRPRVQSSPVAFQYIYKNGCLIWDMEKLGMGLEKLKKVYNELQKKHKLPSFESLNEDFHIEKIAESETEIPIREVRKFVGDKLANYMRFVENLLNPTNVPMFVFSLIKMIDSEDKKRLSEIYKELVKEEVSFIKLELEFNEEKEAQFIKDYYKLWQVIKKDMLRILGKIDERWDDKSEANNKGYFG